MLSVLHPVEVEVSTLVSGDNKTTITIKTKMMLFKVCVNFDISTIQDNNDKYKYLKL